jgi:hypothetical protein
MAFPKASAALKPVYILLITTIVTISFISNSYANESDVEITPIPTVEQEPIEVEPTTSPTPDS